MTTLSPSGASSGAPRTGLRLTPRQSLGPYRFARLLGRGGTGEGYAAEQIRAERLPAIDDREATCDCTAATTRSMCC